MAIDKLRYIKTDFSTYREALIDRLKSRWPSTWNDYSSSSVGSMLLDLMAWTVATMAYLVNATFSESFVSSMRLRESAIRHGNSIGYRLRGTTASTVKCYVALPNAAASDCTIPKGTSITAGNPKLRWEVSSDVTVLAGNRYPISVVTTSSSGQITSLSVVNGSAVIVINDEIDAREYVETGHELVVGSTFYVITEIRYSAATGRYSQLILSDDYSGSTGTLTDFSIVDRRIELTQGYTSETTVTASSVETERYSILLGKTNLVEGSVSVTVNGSRWKEVDTLYGAIGEVYALRLLPDGTYSVTFGDGTNGNTLPASATVTLSYRTCDGSSGNVPAGSISTTLLVSSGSGSLSFSIDNNYCASSGGSDRETIEEARQKLPSIIGSGGRAVTSNDYAAFALKYSGNYGKVRYARTETRAANTLVEGNLVRIYVWPKTGNFTPPALTDIAEYVQRYAVATDYVVVNNGNASPLPVSCRVKPKPGYTTASVTTEVTTAYSTLVENSDPSIGITVNEIIDTLSALNGVDQFTLVTPVSDLTLDVSSERFSAPSSTETQDLSVMSEEVSGSTRSLTYQIPAYPLQPWSVRLYVETATGTAELKCLPSGTSGYAVVVPTTANQLSADFPSRLNLRTGALELCYEESILPGDVSYRLVAVDAYDSNVNVDLWISYSGVDNASKRREIRARLRDWASGFASGSTLFLAKDDTVPVSVSNVESVINEISGIVSITHLSMMSPTSTTNRYDAGDGQLISLGKIYIQNKLD